MNANKIETVLKNNSEFLGKNISTLEQLFYQALSFNDFELSTQIKSVLTSLQELKTVYEKVLSMDDCEYPATIESIASSLLQFRNSVCC